MPVLVDSSVILDIATSDEHWGEWSRATLAETAERELIVINPLIYAEVSVRYETVDELESVLQKHSYVREALPYMAAFLAGKAFRAYRQRGGIRTSPMPDFYIGAHAAVSRYRLLTRDAARYRSYFPTVRLIAPDQ